MYQTRVHMLSRRCVQKYGSSRIGVKSLPAKTQNLNEWFSDVVWKRVQETVFVGYETLVACDYDVVLTFDEGGGVS